MNSTVNGGLLGGFTDVSFLLCYALIRRVHQAGAHVPSGSALSAETLGGHSLPLGISRDAARALFSSWRQPAACLEQLGCLIISLASQLDSSQSR